MRAVVADTGPLNYLVLIDLVCVLPLLFGIILVPDEVKAELSHSQAPLTVREWLASEPPWLDIRSSLTRPDADLRFLGDGEQAAITLALEIGQEARGGWIRLGNRTETARVPW